MIKVSGGGKNPGAVRAHLAYIDRHGKLDVYTDDGERLRGKAVAADLVDDWNLDVGKGQYRPQSKSAESDRRPKQVFNIVFSMPAGTHPQKLLAATQKFAREKFALRHRYAMVLHTDQAHPHVHLVVKAQGEDGQRLYIRKATLAEWREDFAQYLRGFGVAANATPTAVRGKAKNWKRDKIYRAAKRGQSTFMRAKAEAVAEDLRAGRPLESGRTGKLHATRRSVMRDWQSTGAWLRAQRQDTLATAVDKYLASMPLVVTEREVIGKQLLRALTSARLR
jgi:hypothetical protein